MTTSLEQLECPVCGQHTNIHDLGRAGLTAAELQKLREYIHEGNLGTMLNLADSIIRRLDPASTSIELSIQEKLSEFGNRFFAEMNQMNRQLSGVSEKIVGPGIGEISEMIAVETLRQAFPKDDFDQSQAVHGTDIVATVNHENESVGKISVSIKDTKQWNGEFLEQLEKNTEQDSTKIGLLVSKKLPKGANTTGQVIHNKEKLYFLVQPQYTQPIYAAIRQLVIHMHKTEEFLDTKEKELMQVERISKALVKWISGNEYAYILQTLEEITAASTETDDLLLKMRDGVEKNIKKACDKQQEIRRQVLNNQGLLSGLKSILREQNPTGEVQK